MRYLSNAKGKKLLIYLKNKIVVVANYIKYSLYSKRDSDIHTEDKSEQVALQHTLTHTHTHI